MTFSADEAPSGQQGIEMVRQADEQGKPYQAVLVDWQMPGLDGIETGRRILGLGNLRSRPRLIMVTAYGREEVLKRAEDAGFENVLIKPVTPSMLFDSMAQVLGSGKPTDRPSESRVSAARNLTPLSGARILLVEDNEINREVVVGLLEDDGLRIDQAENGQRAVEMIEASDYDLVLMDMQMPVLDGVAATRAIRANPRFALLPIIAMTANVMAGDREKCREAGMNDHIPKPIEPDHLFEVLLRWIRPRTASAPAASGSSVSPAVARPDSLLISGIATADGLRRAGGNRKRYESLLSLFADSQADSVSAIRAALASNDSATAQRLAHSLRGASANLGAAALAESASAVEAAIQSNQSASVVLEALSKSLDATTAAIRSALAAENRMSITVNGDPAAVAQPLARLKKLLESDDGDASDFVLDARPQLAKVLTPAELDGLVVQVGNFAYADALQSLSGIAARLSLALE